MAAEGASSGTSTRRPSGVNGAAAGWPRKVGITEPNYGGERRVNGAAAGWPRKVPPWPAHGQGNPRQWGRGRMAAEGCLHGRPAPRRSASMGPRPDGRGRAPRADGHDVVRRCVNGAAAGWPRKADVQRASEWVYTRVNGAAAGWPRKASRWPCARWPRTCVNGAAAGWPRKAPAPGSASSTMMRQWGRGRMAAEGCLACRPRSRRSGVNGAAAGWPRKAGRSSDDDQPLLASMGPRPDGRGRASRSATALSHFACVNGAAAGWPRKAQPSQRGAARLNASMGPRPDGRGREFAADHAGDHEGASMGPRPDGRGRATAGQQVSAVRRASMGPRPDGRGRPGAGRQSRRSGCVNGAAAGWPRKVRRPRHP